MGVRHWLSGLWKSAYSAVDTRIEYVRRTQPHIYSPTSDLSKGTRLALIARVQDGIRNQPTLHGLVDCYITLYGWKSESTLISGHLVNFFVVKWKDEAGDPTVEHINKALAPYAELITRGCVDATDGVVQDQIFDLCLLLGAAFLPLRDAANQNAKFLMKTTSDMPSLDIYGKHRRFLGQQFISINSDLYKNEFVTSIARKGQGLWSFPSDTTREFFNHLGNEKRVEDKNKLIWKPKYSGAPQHFFSSTIYAFAAASLYRNELYYTENSKPKRGNRR